MHTAGDVDFVRLRIPNSGYSFAFVAVSRMICMLHDPDFVVLTVTILGELAIS